MCCLPQFCSENVKLNLGVSWIRGAVVVFVFYELTKQSVGGILIDRIYEWQPEKWLHARSFYHAPPCSSRPQDHHPNGAKSALIPSPQRTDRCADPWETEHSFGQAAVFCANGCKMMCDSEVTYVPIELDRSLRAWLLFTFRCGAHHFVPFSTTDPRMCVYRSFG